MWDDTGIEGSLSSSINSTATSPDLKIPHCIFLFQILHLQPFGNVSTMQFLDWNTFFACITFRF